jgi:pilus assembly protein Flp/PilA
MKAKILAFLREETGLTTVEYAVAGGIIVVGLIAAFTTLGGKVKTRIDTIAGGL